MFGRLLALLGSTSAASVYCAGSVLQWCCSRPEVYCLVNEGGLPRRRCPRQPPCSVFCSLARPASLCFRPFVVIFLYSNSPSLPRQPSYVFPCWLGDEISPRAFVRGDGRAWQGAVGQGAVRAGAVLKDQLLAASRLVSPRTRKDGQFPISARVSVFRPLRLA